MSVCTLEPSGKVGPSRHPRRFGAAPASHSLLGISSHCLRPPCCGGGLKPFCFEQCQLNIEAVFLLMVSGSSQANCLRADFIAACDSKERKYANTFPTREEKCQVRHWKGSSPTRRSSFAQARRAGHHHASGTPG